MSFDIDFQPKGPEAVRQRMEELRERLGVKDPSEFSKVMKEAAKPPMPIQGYIGNGTPYAQIEGGLPPFDPGQPGSKVQVQAMIERVAREQDIDPKIIRAVVEAESDYKINDVSKDGAKGLMQLMPDTAREMGVSNPFDPYDNLTGGTKYLKQMIARYPGRFDLALAAYNAGPGNVDKAKGIPNFAETRNYVDKIYRKLNLR